MRAQILPFPPSRRVRCTPVEVRLSVLDMVERELRRIQTHEQPLGLVTPSLSLAISWLDEICDWERVA